MKVFKVFKFKSFIGVGYAELHCKTVIFLLLLFSIIKAFSTSFRVDAPVDNKIFLFFFLIYFNKDRFVISPDGILIKSILFFSKNFRLSISNAVDKNFIFLCLQ